MVGIDFERLAKQTMSATEAEAVCIEIEGIRADLKALAVAALRERMSEWGFDHLEEWEAYKDRMDDAEVELWKALARRGVRKVLDQATSRAAATSGICSGKS